MLKKITMLVVKITATATTTKSNVETSGIYNCSRNLYLEICRLMRNLFHNSIFGSNVDRILCQQEAAWKFKPKKYVILGIRLSECNMGPIKG
jgi:hypothetical protein